MKVVLSGGGTGGHIYPALTIGEELCRLRPGTELLYIGTASGLEADLVPKAGIPFTTVASRGLNRKNLLASMQAAATALGGVWQSIRLLRQFQPQVVVGTGGYVCGPVLLAAFLLGIPTLIQEQNAIAGITNRLLSHVVDGVALGYAEASSRFSSRCCQVVTGNPVRREVLTAQREESLQKLGLSRSCKTLLVAGGSRGARSINQAMLEVHAALAAREDVQVLHITGKNEYNNVVDELRRRGLDEAPRLFVRPYLHEMPAALAAADLAVFRAGALGIAELTVRGIPAILVPYPYAAENHQEWNARVLANAGAAKVLGDAQLEQGLLRENVLTLLDDSQQLAAMAEASRALGRPQAARDIAEWAVKLAK